MESTIGAVVGMVTMLRSQCQYLTIWSLVLSARVLEVGSRVRTSGGHVPVSEAVARWHVYLVSVVTRVLDVVLMEHMWPLETEYCLTQTNLARSARVLMELWPWLNKSVMLHLVVTNPSVFLVNVVQFVLNRNARLEATYWEMVRQGQIQPRHVENARVKEDFCPVTRRPVPFCPVLNICRRQMKVTVAPHVYGEHR